MIKLSVLKKKLFPNLKKRQILQKLGFSSDSEGILNRFYREEGNWNPHLENTKKQILESAKTKKKGNVVVLGSGWLLDVPLKELAELFSQVYLVDIVHSKQVKHKISKLENVKIIEHDISGGALEGVYDLVKNNKKNNKSQLEDIKLTKGNFGLPESEEVDFVVSVNILSQLDYFALHFLRKNTTFCSISLNEFKERIQKAHLSFLPKGKTCLITDFKETIYKENEKIIRENFLLKVKFPKKDKIAQWKWEFDTHKSYYSDGNTFMNVMAVEL